MLNELCQLADSLETAGITPKEWHPKLKMLPKATDKAPCFRISISKCGEVTSVEKLSNELTALLRKWEPSNGNSFPGFNLVPLYRLTKDEQKKLLKIWRDGKAPIDMDTLNEWLIPESRNWKSAFRTKLSKCLKDTPEDLYELVNGIDSSSSFAKLFTYLKEISLLDDVENHKSFEHSLEGYLLKSLSEGGTPKEFLPLLIHEGSDTDDVKKIEADRGSVSICMDISDWDEFPVASEKSIEQLNDALTITVKSIDDIEGIDAFGESIVGSSEKLPGVKLPLIAEVKLRAMNSESPCQYRYGTIDANSYPVGNESRKRAKGALEWLGDESRNGETWGRADVKELLFAYPSVLSPKPTKLAACFGASKVDDTETRFADVAKDAINGLKGLASDLRNLDIRVFSLRKMDKARTKVVFNRNYTAQRLVDASAEWKNGCANIPTISLRAWGAIKGEIITPELLVPFPLQIASCLNRVWKLDGTTKVEVPVVEYSQGIELLLEQNPEPYVLKLLSVFLQNSKGILLFIGGQLIKNELVEIRKNDSDKHKLLLPSILGLLLYKLGVRKDQYMKDAPFLVGRMLKLADELHALYCKDVRGGNIPPQLIGNSLMTSALDNPIQCLAQLALRLKPYYGWAQTCKSADFAGLAHYFIGQYGDVAAQLALQTLPNRMNDSERAQLLLGYLASNPKKETN